MIARHRPSALRRVTALLALLLIAAAPAVATVVDNASRPFDDDQYALLVMGSDMGPWRPQSVLDGRSDALHLVVVTPSEGSASILSFPRDLYVPVPGLGSTRINAALTRSPETAVETVESLTGVAVDDWIVTGMGAFTRGIDAFGGLRVDVPQRLNVDANVVPAGVQDLDGMGTLVFTRDRKSRSDGDFGRNRAQAEVLALLHRELVAQRPSPAQLMTHVDTLRRHTVSSIPGPRYPILASVALRIEPERVVRAQVPGVNANRGGAAVVVPTGGAETLFADLRDDGMLTP